MRCLQVFWERIPGSWTSVGKGTFSVGWQFIVRDVELQSGDGRAYWYTDCYREETACSIAEELIGV